MDNFIIYDTVYDKKHIGCVVLCLPFLYDVIVVYGSMTDSPDFYPNIPRLHFSDHRVTEVTQKIMNYRDIFLRLNINGMEYSFIFSLKEEEMKRIKQIVINVHTPCNIQSRPELYHGLDNIKNEDLVHLFKKMNKTHTLAHICPNNSGGIHYLNGVKFPNIFQCTFVRNDYILYKTVSLHSLPMRIDRENDTSSVTPPEIFDAYPFVPICTKNMTRVKS